MPLPIKHLPLIQNWDCHTCGSCCTDYWVPVSKEERDRITAQGWEKEPDFQGRPLFTKFGKWWKRKWRLNHRDGDRCIFLNDLGLCRIHAKFGLEAKPFACRLYPYILIPAGDHFRISLRFACPSAAGNKGRSLEVQSGEIRDMAREMEIWDQPEGKRLEPGPPPPLKKGQRVGWGDLDLFVQCLLMILRDHREPIPRKMLQCLALARNCRPLKYDTISGPRLRELLELLRTAIRVEVPRQLQRFPRPGWIGRILFRSLLAIYLRKDQGSRRGVSKKGKIALMAAMYRMVKGRGPLPQLQVGLPERNIEDFEMPLGPLRPESEEALERYYTIKVESLQFCGPTNFRLPFWDGFDSLALTLPMILWAARGYRELGQPESIYKAITLIDENFGYNPILGQSRQKMAVWILSFRQELDRLIAWYGQ